MAIPGLFSFYVNMFNVKFWKWLDLNHGPLLLEATALPTEPQSLTKVQANLVP